MMLQKANVARTLLLVISAYAAKFPAEMPATDLEVIPGDNTTINNTETSDLFEGDIIMDERLKSVVYGGDKTKRDTIIGNSFKWPRGVLYYRLHSSLSSYARSVVRVAMNHISGQTCIRFKYKIFPFGSYVLIYKGKGCSSHIGRAKGNTRQLLSIGKGCATKGIVVHELLHALGFFHEQSRLDRDKYVTIHFENIKKGKAHNFRKYKWWQASTLGTCYDLNSVMHYRRKAFSKNGLNTITPKDPWANVGQRQGLSVGDVVQLRRLYKCPLPRECTRYKWLSHSSRAVRKKGGPYLCDKTLKSGWYRFRGNAGNDMPTKCVPINRCGTRAPGWLVGSPPTKYRRYRRRVCFHWNNNCCRWRTTVNVRNCGHYNVYYLRKLATCRLRYCGNKQ